MAMSQKANLKSSVKQMIRQLAPVSGTLTGMPYRTAEEIDAEITSLMLQGYRISNTHYLGSQMDSEHNVMYFGVLYVFVLEQSEIERMKRADTEKEA